MRKQSNKEKLPAEKRLIEILGKCTIIKDEGYPNSLLYMLGDGLLIQQSNIGKYLWCSHSGLWVIFEREYNMDFLEISILISDTFDKVFNVIGYSAIEESEIYFNELHKYLKNKTLIQNEE